MGDVVQLQHLEAALLDPVHVKLVSRYYMVLYPGNFDLTERAEAHWSAIASELSDEP